MRYAATFSPGFENFIAEALTKALGTPPQQIKISGGLVRFDSSAPLNRVLSAPIFANVFIELGDSPRGTSFERMVRQSRFEKLPAGVRARTYRVRFSRANKFESVPQHVLAAVERDISRATGLRPNRLGADVEYWFVLRADGGGFLGLLVPDKNEIKPEKGELKPSLAAMIAQFAGVRSGDTVLDPFAGHGSLPLAATRLARNIKPIYLERDRSLMNFLRRRAAATKGEAILGDARSLPLDDASVDLVLTDPPWGLFRAESADDLERLYTHSLAEMARVLKPKGRIALLCARDIELSELLPDGFFELKSADTLVGGKKATVHVFARKTPKFSRNEE